MKRRYFSRTCLQATSLVALYLIAGSASPVLAKTYRWVDEQGNTVYSQNPPPTGDYSEIKLRKDTPQEEQAAAGDNLKRMQQQLGKVREGRGEEAKQQKEKEAADAARKRGCENARHNLTLLNNPRIGSLRDEEGNYESLDEERRDTLIKEAEKQVEEFCGDNPEK